MSSGVPWATQFDSNNPLSSSDANWGRGTTVVNTPQTNPASWPQLGAAPHEQEPLHSGAMSQGQGKPAADDSGWGSAPNPPGDGDPNGTSGWGRPDKAPSGLGWGMPSTWGQQHPVSVDDGTAVWSNSTAASQQGGWGGQGPKINSDTQPTGWGNPESAPASNIQLPEPTPQPTQSNPQAISQPSTSTTQPASTHLSWVKAASAGLPSSSASSESPPAETEQEQRTDSSAGTTPLPTVSDPDPVQQIVNSHEGWGKKPIVQGTGWNINEGPGVGRPPSSVSNGTEAWGKASSQMQSSAGWGEQPSANKPPSNWGASNATQTPTPVQNWGVPSQPQQARPYSSGGNSSVAGWGEPPQANPTVNNGRWNDMPGQAPVTPTGWGNAASQPNNNNTGWGAGGVQHVADNSTNQNWGAAANQMPMQSSSGWVGNVMPQSPVADQSSWNRAPPESSMNMRRSSTVDNGTAAWGNPSEYSTVNMWDKSGKNGALNPEAVQGNPAMNSEAVAKGWGAPPTSNPPANRPPSPKGWDASPTRPNAIDNGASWGKPAGAGGQGWNSSGKPSGWGQANDMNWGQESPSGWNQPIGKTEASIKSNMDYAPRGMMPPPSNINQPNVMLRNQVPPVLPAQLQNQFHQIRHAVQIGVIPSQVLNPQLMSPQHMQALLQLVNKASEYQHLQVQWNKISQNKVLPPLHRQTQIEQLSRALQQCSQQIETLRMTIMQNVSQKMPAGLSKSNGSIGGMQTGRANPSQQQQQLLSPLNTIGVMGQSLPTNAGYPSGSSQKSRLMNWKQPNPMARMENLPPSMAALNPGPGGDANPINGLRYNSPIDEFNKTGLKSSFMAPEIIAKPNLMSDILPRSKIPPAAEQNSALADIGPPEFTPGVPWKGFKSIDPESDPNITPGSVAMAKTISINTVRDADQVLKRERSALSESSTGAPGSSADDQTSASVNISSSTPTSDPPSQMWSTGTGNSMLTTTLSNPRSSLSQDLWKNSGPSSQSALSTQAPPFMANKETNPSSWENNRSGWDRSRNQHAGSWGGQQADPRGSYVVLTNIADQDASAVRQLCMEHSPFVSFQAQCPMNGMALVRYQSPNEAANAKDALHMQLTGTSMVVATIVTDDQVKNWESVTSGGSWGTSASGESRYLSGVGSTGGFLSQPPQQNLQRSQPDFSVMSSSSVTPMWGNSPMPNNLLAGGGAGGWQNTPVAPSNAWSGGGAEEVSRIMSPMHSLLPENLLGGENL